VQPGGFLVTSRFVSPWCPPGLFLDLFTLAAPAAPRPLHAVVFIALRAHTLAGGGPSNPILKFGFGVLSVVPRGGPYNMANLAGRRCSFVFIPKWIT